MASALTSHDVTAALPVLSTRAMAGLSMAIASWLTLIATILASDRFDDDGYRSFNPFFWWTAILLATSFTATLLAIAQILQSRRRVHGLRPACLSLLLILANFIWFNGLIPRL
ncbi:MAG TPA: hypothetical protein VFS19_04445 [Planctomycetota bacterium]|nr:hypothetical protein [Planctomycetota bacterium]